MKLFGISVGYGNSIKDKLYWFINGFMTNMGFILWGGCSPPPAAPTTTTVNQTNIPCYAQPYVMNMLNAAQAQIYNPSGTGFNPYVPYSNDPTKYVAGPSPEQQQAYSAAANMKVPGQYGVATGATMGTIGNLTGLGAQMGQAGNQYYNMATNPAATQAFMNPYVQASLAPQLQLANQQYGIAGQEEQSAAGRAGAFGGSREALMNSLNQQNQMLAQNQLISQGYNTAFNQAQQAQQYGAGLGLQGQQGQLAAMQAQLGGANQLASIGGACLAARQGIANQQNQFGAAQQANQQQIINQAVQNYATAQQYPYMQLGTLNAMLRGLPMNQVSTATYMAPPSSFSQLAGLGVAGLGAAAKATGAKKGGVIKAASGIPMNMYSPQQLQQVEKSPYSTPIAKIVADGYQQEDSRLKANPEAPKLLAQVPPNPQPMQQMPPQDRMGVGAIATPPDLTTMRAASGGLLAFAGKDESLVPKEKDEIVASDLAPDVTEEIPTKSFENGIKASYPGATKKGIKIGGFDTTAVKAPDVSTLDEVASVAQPQEKVYAESDPRSLYAKGHTPTYDEMLRHQVMFPTDTNTKAVAENVQALKDEIAARKKSSLSDTMIRAGLEIAGGTSPYALTNIAQGATKGFDFYQEQKAKNIADMKEMSTLELASAKEDAELQQKAIDNILKDKQLDADTKARLQQAKELAVDRMTLMKMGLDIRAMGTQSQIDARTLKQNEVKADKGKVLGTAVDSLDALITQAENVKNHPGRFHGANPFTGALETRIGTYIPGIQTEGKDFLTAMHKLKSEQFLGAVAGIKGTGMGRVMQSEVPILKDATGVLSTEQTPKEFDKNINDIIDAAKRARAKIAAEGAGYGLTPEDLGVYDMKANTSANQGADNQGAFHYEYNADRTQRRKVYGP